jgi:hypothetical protein
MFPKIKLETPDFKSQNRGRRKKSTCFHVQLIRRRNDCAQDRVILKGGRGAVAQFIEAYETYKTIFNGSLYRFLRN